MVGRSHRSKEGKARLAAALDRSRTLLGIPEDYRIGIVPASDTGAVEMALWSLLGPRPVSLLVWESFGKGWAVDVQKQLRLDDVEVHSAEYGELPNLDAVDCDRDVVFVWNGTTSGVRVPDGSWIDRDRKGLTICDATSAAFAMRLPWDRLDVVTYSWQKVLGGEAAHGMLILSPRAVERLETFRPPRPLPKIFRMTKARPDGTHALNEAIFTGSTINTPSMLCVEDYLDALSWAERMGGVAGLSSAAEGNLAAITDWVNRTSWVDFLARVPEQRSPTSVCLTVTDPAIAALSEADQRARIGRMTTALAAEGVGFDIGGYRDAPPGLRLWAGPTVEREDLEALLPWLDWAWNHTRDA